MEPYWESVKQIILESDIVLEILDARMVELSRNKKLEELISSMGRQRIFVINKADLVPRKDLEHAAEKILREKAGEVVYVSNKNKRTIKLLLGKIRQVFSKHGKRKDFHEQPIIKKPYREAKGDIIVGVVGYPNVGKSSVINALAFKKKMQVSTKAGTTHGVHWVSAGGGGIRLIDTPGVVPLEYMEEAKLGLISAKSPEKIKDPDAVAGKIVEMFIDNDCIRKMEGFYKVDLNNEKNPYEIISKIALQKKHLKKGGLPDETRTSTMIIRDWQNGKLRL